VALYIDYAAANAPLEIKAIGKRERQQLR